MPILLMGLLALAVFIVLLFLFLGANAAERRQREEMEKSAERPQASRTAASSAGK